MADFTHFLKVKSEDIEAPKPLALGHFFATIRGWKTAERDYDKANGGPKTPVVELTFVITSPDTDAEDEGATIEDSKGKIATRDYRLPEGMHQIRKLAEDACDLPTAGLEFEDILNHLKGQEVKVYNESRAGREEGEFFSQIKKVMSAHG